MTVENSTNDNDHRIPDDRNTLVRELAALIEEALPEIPQGIPPSADLFDAGLDSMAIMQLLIFLEDRYGVEIPPEAVTRENFSTVDSLAALLIERKDE